jgi:hypothetical protein
MTFHSQAGQDQFVLDTIGLVGTFLDVGCGDPVEISNTLALEEAGWKGLLVDRSHEEVLKCRARRKNPVLEADAAVVNWLDILPSLGLGPDISYLSLDIDGPDERESFPKVLCDLYEQGFRFKVITCEHDHYRLGNRHRANLRNIMSNQGYILTHPDVTCAGWAFEDWWMWP